MKISYCVDSEGNISDIRRIYGRFLSIEDYLDGTIEDIKISEDRKSFSFVNTREVIK